MADSRSWHEILLAQFGDAGDVTLPSLTREELLVLSDEPALAHAGDASWWQEIDAGGRELVLQTAQRGLVARNLLTAAPDGDGLVVADGVRLVLQARRNPSWLVVLGEPEINNVQLTASGIDLSAGHTDAVLLAARIEGVYAHRLVRPALAVDEVADWLLREPFEDAVTAGRTIEVIIPAGETDDLRSRRAILLGDGAEWVLAEVDDEGPGDPSPLDPAALRSWLSGALPVGSTDAR